MTIHDFLSTTWPYIAAIVVALIIIALVGRTKNTGKLKCPYCQRETQQHAPYSERICQDCCKECNNLKAEMCKHLRNCDNCRFNYHKKGKKPCPKCNNGSKWGKSELTGQEFE